MEFQRDLDSMVMVKQAELVAAFRKQLAIMSYFNAAEGDYFMEKTKRDECRAKLLTFAELLRQDGLSDDAIKKITSDFMVSERDYLPRRTDF